MPWSEWQDPFVTKLYGNETLLSWDRSVVGMPAGAVGYVSTADPTAFKYGATFTDGTTGHDGVQFAKNPYWAEYRDDTPPKLDALTEGVNYAQIPGTSQYVEYAPIDNVWLGWEFPDGQTGHVFRSPNPDTDPWVGEGSIGWQLDTSWPTEGYLYADPSQDRVWDSWSSYDPVPLLNPGNPGNVDFTITVNYAPSAGTTQGRAEATWYDVRPYMLVQLPAWRYWMPGSPPLRQKQRNDGLARGVLRARSTSSIQNSVRQNSYR